MTTIIRHLERIANSAATPRPIRTVARWAAVRMFQVVIFLERRKRGITP